MGRIRARRPNVVVAEFSTVIGESIKGELERAGYKVSLVQDGLAALELLVRSRPDCLVAAHSLPSLSGSQLCGIVKDGMEDSGLPVIVYRTDGRDDSLATGYTPADEELDLDLGLEQLSAAVGRLLEGRAEVESAHWHKGHPSVAECVARAMDKSIGSYAMLQAIYQVALKCTGPADLASGLLLVARHLLGCEVAALALSQQPVRFYHSGAGMLSKEDFEGFCRVCEADFLGGGLDAAPGTWEVQPHVRNEAVHERLGSYRCFVLGEREPVGSLYIASTRQNFFTPRTEGRIGFFVDHITLFLRQALRIALQEGDRCMLRSTLSKFVPQEIIDDLVREGSQSTLLANEMRRVSILFCDVRDFTSFCERTSPEQVVGFLNSYFDTMVGIIKRHGGSIDKFIGDAIMAVFGAPVSYRDNEERAVRAALEMRRAWPQMQEYGRRFLGIPSIEYGIGVHCGEVIVGTIGCQDKTNYTVIGDSVNLAFRLEGVTKAYRVPIIISKAVRDVLGEGYFLSQLDTVNVKGKSVGMPIYRLDGEELPAAYRENYQKGLDLYYAGAWSRAAEYFDRAHRAVDDGPAAVMAHRCRDFVEHPPQNWDGSYVFTTK